MQYKNSSNVIKKLLFFFTMNPKQKKFNTAKYFL